MGRPWAKYPESSEAVDQAIDLLSLLPRLAGDVKGNYNRLNKQFLKAGM